MPINVKHGFVNSLSQEPSVGFFTKVWLIFKHVKISWNDISPLKANVSQYSAVIHQSIDFAQQCTMSLACLYGTHWFSSTFTCPCEKLEEDKWKSDLNTICQTRYLPTLQSGSQDLLWFEFGRLLKTNSNANPLKFG